MPTASAARSARARAQAYEVAPVPEQRKRLGQFFTGLPLGRLLASLALAGDAATILDPMAGNGDLLDAAWETARTRGSPPRLLAGIEIEKETAGACKERLRAVTGGADSELRVLNGDAFKPTIAEQLGERGFDLVITNPPFVRYQARDGEDRLRSNLARIIETNIDRTEADAWLALVAGYSGLADLSVPSLLQAASFVRHGGRLGLVLPAAWRSRDYADVVRYLLIRFFEIECVVEDEAPGWFSGALVRTHLVVARRLDPGKGTPLSSRADWSSAPWLQVARSAASTTSLVGSAFESGRPEENFASWVRSGDCRQVQGIRRRSFSAQDEWHALRDQASSRRWFHALEGSVSRKGNASPRALASPDIVRDLIPPGLADAAFASLNEQGIEVGQGLRTGCNRFFYVTSLGVGTTGMELVEASAAFDRMRLAVPASCLKPVVRRQSETEVLTASRTPAGRVLDLRGWILPEDREAGSWALSSYMNCNAKIPETMPRELARYVRRATTAIIDEGANAKTIPELSAVAPNIRRGEPGKSVPRFWYMLPDFTARHVPLAFVPRVNHFIPWVEANADPAVVIDANFSTFWSRDGSWSRHALKALFDSAWCRALMEAYGAPLGGGALKLEATHLRRMPLPRLSGRARAELGRVGRSLTRDNPSAQSEADRIVLSAIYEASPELRVVSALASVIKERAEKLSSDRQRAA